MDITWHADFAAQWREQGRQGRAPHALLLTGPRGVGKRAAAAWLARQKLSPGADGDLPQYPFERPEHADLRWLEPPEDKHSIVIDQVRELVAELALTSYEGRGKVAVVEPADLMTDNAANSLLKTLEEPPGDALLILVADRTGRLPATIFSRCQRVHLRIPDTTDGLAWLDRLQPGRPWAEALAAAQGAPLRAIEAAEALETTQAMSRDFAAVADGRVSPIEVAERWSKLEPRFVLEWLAGQVQGAARALAGGSQAAPGLAIGQSVLQRIDSRNLFCYLDIINRLRGRPGGSFNVQLALESLLIDWATGLRELERT